MKVLFELSQEYNNLPTEEILAVFKGEQGNFQILISNPYVLVVESSVTEKDILRLSQRISLTYYLDEFLFSCPSSLSALEKHAKENKIQGEGTVAIRYKNRSSCFPSQNFVKTLATIYTKDRVVNLENPDIELRLLLTDETFYVGIKKAKIEKTLFEKRKVQFRPYFSPISLHPKLARALVNLSCVKKGSTLLDPFCGTGGILLEAGLLGINVIGSDIEEKMIEGCKKTLDFFKIKSYKLYQSDIGKISEYVTKVDAIVTDFPYGKSTTTKGEDHTTLYKRSFKSMNAVLKKGGVAIIGAPEKKVFLLAMNKFHLRRVFEIPAHRSLTRYFAVFQK